MSGLNFEPKYMQLVVDLYNDSIHKGLSNLIGMPVTPNMVDSNYFFENILVYNIQRQNLLTSTRKGYYLRPGDKVRVYRHRKNKALTYLESNYFDGTWTVQGYKNKMISVISPKGVEFLVPRWMLVRVN